MLVRLQIDLEHEDSSASASHQRTREIVDIDNGADCPTSARHPPLYQSLTQDLAEGEFAWHWSKDPLEMDNLLPKKERP
jgi:hypothetical protein